MDANFSVGDGSHRFFIEPGLRDKMRNLALGLSANVGHVDAEHLRGVRVRLGSYSEGHYRSMEPLGR